MTFVKRLIHFMTLLCYLGVICLTPFEQARAAVVVFPGPATHFYGQYQTDVEAAPSGITVSTSGQFDPGYDAVHSPFHNQWQRLYAPVAANGSCVDSNQNSLVFADQPKDNWVVVATSVRRSNGSYSIQMEKGAQWITKGNILGGKSGQSSAKIASALMEYANSSPIIFARYSPELSELRINALRTIKLNNGNFVSEVADFTPHHGNRYIVTPLFRSSAENVYCYAGHNPLEAFRGDNTDPTFYNISWSGVQVAVGLAMRHNWGEGGNAQRGYIAVDHMTYDTQESSSGSFFSTTTCIEYLAYANADWYIALPVDMQPYGSQGTICAVVTSSGTCDDPGHLVWSGVSIQQWKGGNMPSIQQTLNTQTTCQSGFTIGFFAVILAIAITVLTYGAGAEMAVGALDAAEAAAVPAEATLTGIGLDSAAEIGAAVGSSYAVTQGGSLATQQNGIFGSVGSGINAQTAPSSSFGQQNNTDLQTQIVTPAITQWNAMMLAVGKGLAGNCDMTWPVSACTAAGLDPGDAPRPDTWTMFFMPQYLQYRLAFCQAALAGHYSVDVTNNPIVQGALAQCAAGEDPTTLLQLDSQ